MPHSIHFTGTGAEVRFTGVVTTADVAEAARKAASFPYPGGRRFVLFDASAAEGFDVLTREVPELADLPEIHGTREAPLVVAIVAPQDEGFALARRWQLLAQERPVEGTVLRTRAVALAWLRGRGIDVSDIPPDPAG